MSNAILDSVTPQDADNYQTHGVVILRGVFKQWIELLRNGADEHIANPGPNALIHGQDNSQGRFLEDFCCWQRLPQYQDFVHNSLMGAIGAKLMRSQSAQFFHDHLLYKEGGSTIATPWHQDMPYYCVKGEQTVSFWIPLEDRAQQFSLKCLAGSHKLSKEIRPTSWATNESFYQDDAHFMDLPDIDDNDNSIKTWSIAAGDVVAFNFKTIHCANANTVKSPSRTLSFRLVGDDTRFFKRSGRTSPNFPDINQKSGERLREDWFPTIWPADDVTD